jgi:hypothetical protein
MPLATGQFTIIDYNDALSLSGYIGCNVAKTQMYNQDNGSYNPDWSTGSFLVLTPTLFILGTSTDIITNTAVTSVTWFYNNNGTETAITADSTHVFSGTKNQVLTIKTNELAGIPGRDYICKVIYHDPSTSLDLTYKMSVTMTRVINGSGITDAIAYAPSGTILKNGNAGPLTAQCQLWRGSTVDVTNVTYRWFAQDATIWAPTTLTSGGTSGSTSIVVGSVTGMIVGQSIIVGTATAIAITAINTGTKTLTLAAGGLSSAQTNGVTVKVVNYDADAGSGWRLIPSDIANNITGVTTSTVSVYGAYFVDIIVLMCLILDTDSASSSYNSVFKDTITFIDQSDPIQVVITSSGGDVFKNGAGSSTLTARLYQAGAEIDAGGSSHTYTWSIFDQNGNASTFNGGASTKTGKSITVGDLDVSVKATFQVSVS